MYILCGHVHVLVTCTTLVDYSVQYIIFYNTNNPQP
jgi:hypothetical protein